MKRKIAGLLVASLMLNQITPAFAAVQTDSNAEYMQQMVETSSNAVEPEQSTGNLEETATSSNAANMEEITMTIELEWNPLIEGVPEMDEFEFVLDDFGSTFMEDDEYYGNQISSEAESYYQLLVDYYSDVIEDGDDASVSMNIGTVDEFAGVEDIQTYFNNVSNEMGYYFQQAVTAFRYDHPEMFWAIEPSQQTKVGYYQDAETGEYYGEITATVNIDCDYNSDDVRAMADEMDQVLNDWIIYGATVETSANAEYNLLKSYYSMICEWAEYDETLVLEHSHSAYGIFVEKTAVCEGYAKAFKVLCDKYDVPCVLVVGQGGDPNDMGPHMWNYVQMDNGNWYAIDVTFADQEEDGVMGCCFLVGENTVQDAFGSYTFNEMHWAENPTIVAGDNEMIFGYPTLSSDAYVPGEVEYVYIPDDTLRGLLLDQYDFDGDGNLTVEEMALITELHISEKSISDLTGLEYAINMTSFICGHTDVTDLTPIGNLKSLESIGIDYSKITSLEPLKHAINLKRISAQGSEVSDLTGLSNLKKLETLFLGYSNVSDLSPIEGCTNLIHLSVYFNELETVPYLNNLTNLSLSEYAFIGNRIPKSEFDGKFYEEQSEEWKEFNGLNTTPADIVDENLYQAILNNNHDLDGDGNLNISEVRWMSSLIANGYGIRELSGMEDAEWLTILKLENNHINDISALNALTKLSNLYLSGNEIENLSPISNCTNLMYLSVANNNLSTIPSFTEFSELILCDEVTNDHGDTVYVPRNMFGGNRIPRENFYGKFVQTPSDAWLDLNSYDPSVVDIPDIRLREELLWNYDRDDSGDLSESEMSEITELYLEGYGIHDLTGLEAAVNLRHLYISDNNIEDLSPIAGLTELYALYVRNNDLTELPDMSGMTNLRLYDEEWNWDENGDEYSVLRPRDMFSGNKIERDEFWQNLYSFLLTDEWLDLNSYDGTLVNIPNERLKRYLVMRYDIDKDREMCASEMLQVKEVSISSSQVDSIQGLEYAKNLQRIKLRNSLVSDLSPLGGLEYLEYCNLDYNKIRDLEPLADCPNLRELTVKFNDIQEVPDFSSCEHLELYGNNEELRNPRAIFTGNKALNTPEHFEDKFSIQLTEEWLALNVYNGEQIEFEDSKLKNALLVYDRDDDDEISVSEALVITGLNLSDLGITSLVGLEYFERLDELIIRNNKISDLTPIAQLPLWKLDASRNRIESCEPLAGNDNIESLNLSNNRLTDISALEECYALVELSVRNNNIAEIPDFTELYELNLYYNWSVYPLNMFGGNPQLTSRDQFEGHFSNYTEENLTDAWYIVNLYDADLVEFEDENLEQALVEDGVDTNGDGKINYSELRSAEYIDISGAGISDLSGLEHTHSLVSLNVSNNNLTNLDVLTTCNRIVYDDDRMDNGYSEVTPFRYLNARNNQLIYLPDLSFLDIWTEDGDLIDMFSGNNLSMDELWDAFPYFDWDDEDFQDWLALNVGFGYAENGRWVQDDYGWKFLDENGKPYTNRYVEDAFGLYYVGSDGYMVTNQWVLCYIDGWEYRRYMGEDGAALRSDEFELIEIDGKYYAFNEDAVAMTNWVFSDENQMANKHDDEAWKYADHCFDNYGAALLGWVKSVRLYGGWKDEYGEAKYNLYFDPETGEKQTGLLTIDGEKYFFDETGAMLSDMEITVDGVDYVIDSNGVLFDNSVFAIVKQPKNVYAVDGDLVKLKITATGVANYQWYYGESSDSWKEVTDDFAEGGNEPVLRIPFSEENMYNRYICVLTDEEGNTLESKKVCIYEIPGRFVEDATWYFEENIWYLFDEEGELVEDAFALSGNELFYVNEEGILANSEYYFSDMGHVYFIDSSGKVTRNAWKFDRHMDVEDEDSDKYWFFFDMQGRMVRDSRRNIDGCTYYFDAEGVMLTGWIDHSMRVNAELGGTMVEDLRYCDPNGSMVKNDWRTIFDRTYYFDAKGRLYTNELRLIEGNYYYFDETGARLENTFIEYNGVIYQIDENGIATEKEEMFAILEEPENAYYHNEEYVEFTLVATGADAYQWYYSADGTSWSEVTDEMGNGYDTDTLVLDTANANEAYQYFCEVTSPKGNKITSNWVAFQYTFVPVVLGDWIYEDDAWRLVDKDGDYIWNKFTIDSGKYYYLDKEGYRVINKFISYGKELYFFGASGEMILDEWIVCTPSNACELLSTDSNAEKFHYMDTKGRSVGYGEAVKYMIDGNTYYFNDAGHMMTGWIIDSQNGGISEADWKDANIYLAENGLPVTGLQDIAVYGGWKNPDGVEVHTFFFRSTDGKLTGRKTLNDGIHFFDETGAMLNGWIHYSDDGVATLSNWKEATFYLDDSSGAKLTDQWLNVTNLYGGWKAPEGYADYTFYLQADGTKMVSGDRFTIIDDNKYYFNETGALLTDCEFEMDGITYVIDSNGIVTEMLTIVEQPRNIFGVEDSTASLYVEALGAETYDWQYSTDGKTWKSVTDDIANGNGTENLDIEINETTEGYQFRCIVTGANGKTLETEAATITITPVPVICGRFVEENGGWRLYDHDNDYVVENFVVDCKKYDGIYYVDDEGYMVTDVFVEVDEHIYYFTESGKMLRNDWKYDDEAEGWRYLNSKGRAIANKEFKIVRLKVNSLGTMVYQDYVFNAEGLMLEGWVSSETNDNADWTVADYYCITQGDDDNGDGGLGNDWGRVKYGWKDITVKDGSEDVTYRFHFDENGKKATGFTSIDGKAYYFDKTGYLTFNADGGHNTESGKPELSWEAVADVKEYRILRSDSEDGEFDLIETTIVTNAVDEEAESGKTYYYKVAAVNEAGKVFVYSNPIGLTCKLERPVITAEIIASTGKIKISWDEVDGAAGYQVYRATSENGVLSSLGTTKETSFTHTGAKAGTTYYYKVVAIAENTDANSLYSEEAAATCILARPTLTANVVASTGKIKLTWDKIEGAAKYEVRYKTTEGGTFTPLKTLTGTSLSHTSAAAGTTYYYEVVAVHGENTAANSKGSATVSVVCALARPTVTAVTDDVTGMIKLSWNTISGADHYIVYRATEADGEYEDVTTTAMTSFEDINTTAGNTYYYTVTAIHGKNAEANSAESVVKAATCHLAQPVLKAVNDAETGTIILNWKQISNAAKYELYRATEETGAYELLGTFAENTVQDTAVTAGTTYYYKVVALHGENAEANSVDSKVESIVCALAQPTLTVTSIESSGKIKLTWSKVSGASKYEVSYATSENGTYSVLKTTTGTSLIHSSAKAGTTYYYSVKAIHANTEANSVASVIGSQICRLARPTVTADNEDTTGTVILSWNEVTGAAGYEVYRAEEADGEYNLIYTGTELEVQDAEAELGKTHYYKVIAVYGNKTEANSADSVEIAGTRALAQPTISVSNVTSSGKIKITWKKVNGATSYQVLRSASKNGSYTVLKTLTGTSLTHSSATAGTTYYYKVIALYSDNAYANSAYSEVKGITCDLAQPTLTVTSVESSGKIKLTWSKVTGASKYEVSYATSKNGTYSVLKTTTGTSLTHSSATTGTTYYYKVKALHTTAEANSAASAIASQICRLARPTVTAGNEDTTGTVILSWKEVAGATGYEVYRAAEADGEYDLIYTGAERETEDTDVELGTTHYYKVIAVYAGSTNANSAESVEVSGTRTLAQPTITVSNVVSSGKIKITWKKVTGATKYQVLRSTSEDGIYSVLKTTTGTSLTNTSAKAGTKYYYKVVALYNDNAYATSAYSDIKGIVCDLARPTIKLSNVASSGKIKISWNAIEGAAKYEVYRATEEDGAYTLLKATTGISLTNTSTTAGQGYYYKVRAIHANTEANSADSAIQYRVCDLARPTVTLTLNTSGKPKITWAAVSGASKYEVWYKTSADGEYSLLKTLTGKSLTHSSAKAKTAYYYKVKAIYSADSAANSAYSSEKSVTTK